MIQKLMGKKFFYVNEKFMKRLCKQGKKSYQNYFTITMGQLQDSITARGLLPRKNFESGD